jgi:hypothetical protein
MAYILAVVGMAKFLTSNSWLVQPTKQDNRMVNKKIVCWRRSGPKYKNLEIRVLTLYVDEEAVVRWARIKILPAPPRYQSESAPEKAIDYAIKIGALVSMGWLHTGSRYFDAPNLSPLEMLTLPRLRDIPNRVRVPCRER